MYRAPLLLLELFYNDCKVSKGTFRYLVTWIFSDRWSMEIKLNQYLVPLFLVLGPTFWKYQVLYPRCFWVLPTFTTVGFYQMDGSYLISYFLLLMKFGHFRSQKVWSFPIFSVCLFFYWFFQFSGHVIQLTDKPIYECARPHRFNVDCVKR